MWSLVGVSNLVCCQQGPRLLTLMPLRPPPLLPPHPRPEPGRGRASVTVDKQIVNGRAFGQSSADACAGCISYIPASADGVWDPVPMKHFLSPVFIDPESQREP